MFLVNLDMSTGNAKEGKCYEYDPDKVFRRFRVVEFPTSFVGLCTEDELELDANLATSTYLKTSYKGKLEVSLTLIKYIYT